MCIKNYFSKIPFGVIENKKKIRKKDETVDKKFGNTGIYVCNPQVLKLLKKNKKINMSDFINYLSNKIKK